MALSVNDFVTQSGSRSESHRFKVCSLHQLATEGEEDKRIGRGVKRGIRRNYYVNKRIPTSSLRCVHCSSCELSGGEIRRRDEEAECEHKLRLQC